MKTLLFSICMSFLYVGFGQAGSAVQKKRLMIGRILRYDKGMRKFEARLDGNKDNSDFADSLLAYNDRLTHFLLDSGLYTLDTTDLRVVAKSSSLQLLTSGDGKMNVITWSVYNPFPVKMCSSIIVGSNKDVVPVSLTDLDNSNIGGDVETRKIIDVSVNGKANYILIGANKCGNICMQFVASIYTVIDGKIVKRKDAFFDGTDHFEEVEFDYKLLDSIPKDPQFVIEGNDLICPVFNESGTELTGSKRYKILP